MMYLEIYTAFVMRGIGIAGLVCGALVPSAF